MPLIDPIGLQGGTDPLALGTSDAYAPIGHGIAPPPDPATQAQEMNQPVSGLPPVPVLAPPTFSQNLIAAGQAMIMADKAGMGGMGSIAAGMGAYNNQLVKYRDEAAKARANTLAEYEIMGKIADRHNTELAMQKKLEAGARLKAAYPQYADIYDADPEAAIKLIAANPPTDPNAPDTSTLTGQEYLDSLKDPQKAARIKAIAAGQYGINKRSKTYNQDMQDVLQFDPEATEINLAARQATRKAFVAGPEARGVTQLNTALGHAAKLMSLVDALHNKSGFIGATIYNKAKNAWVNSKGDDTGLKNYNAVLHNFVDEAAKVYNPTGGTEGERADKASALDPSGGPDQIKSALREQIGLMTSKLDALDQQYKNGMGVMAQKYEFLSPEARKTLMDAGMLDPTEAGNADLNPANVVPPSMVPPKAGAAAPAPAPAQATPWDTPAPAPAGPVAAPAQLDPLAMPVAAPKIIQGTHGNPFTPKSKEDFAAVPSKAWFVNPKDGQVLRKK